MRDGQPLDGSQLHQLQGAPAGLTSSTDVADATSVALQLASSLGLAASSARVLHAGANLSLLLSPASVVARVVLEVGRWRAGGGFADALRDVALARVCAARGAPVVPPLSEAIAGPHRVDGRIVSFWAYRPDLAADHGFEDPVGTGVTLRRVHEALAAASADGELADLPPLPVWDDARTWIRVAPLLSEDRRALLAELHERTSRAITESGQPWQPLHGDAHPGNVLLAASGPVWTDFEEGGRWPVEWDLACLMNAGVVMGHDIPERDAMVRAYGRDPADPRLAPFHVARSIVAAAWMAATGDYRGTWDPSRLEARLVWLERVAPALV